MIFDIIVFDGVDEMDALGPLEVLRSAALLGADVVARLVTRVEQDYVTGSFGLRFKPDGVFEPGQADVLIATGGGWNARQDVGAWGEVQRGYWPQLISQARPTTKILAGVCSGTLMLVHAGVVGSRRAGTHHGAWGDLLASGATLVKQRVVDDGDLVTSGGVTSGIDLALHLVAREIDPVIAAEVGQRMEYPSLVL